MKQARIVYSFVQYIPERLDPGILYISREYGTASHLCCCGCGEEVVTPLNPTDWALTIERGGVTLSPSIGNWSFACRSHYWIRRGRVEWACDLDQRRIDQIRAFDHARKQAYFMSSNKAKAKHVEAAGNLAPPDPGQQKDRLDQFAKWLKDWLS